MKSAPAEATPQRRRNALATRTAILASARRAFAESGYDGVGVRDIARAAGVTAMLVNRYFGSKERLFAEVVADTMASPTILTDHILSAPDPGDAIAGALVDLTSPGATALDGFLILFHSASSERAAEIAREQIEPHHQKTMTDALSGDLGPERAAVLLSLVAGIQVMRQMIGLTALANADPAVLRTILAPMFRRLIDGPEPTEDSSWRIR